MLCVKQRLRSAWVSVQSDHSLLLALRKLTVSIKKANSLAVHSERHNLYLVDVKADLSLWCVLNH